jgi:hypothetical protein
MEKNLMELFQKLEIEFTAACMDSEKFIDGNKSAGTRVRKHMQNIKSLAQRVRVEVQEQKNSVTA